MNPTPETLGKAKGKISSSCQSGSETESFSMWYVRTVHKFVPAYCHSYCFMAKCSFKGLTYAGCVDTRTQPGGESFLPSLLHFLSDSPKFVCCARISFSKDRWPRVAASRWTSTLTSCRAAQSLHFPLVYAKDPALPLRFCSGEFFSPARSSGAIVHGDGGGRGFVIIKLLTVGLQCKTVHESIIS